MICFYLFPKTLIYCSKDINSLLSQTQNSQNINGSLVECGTAHSFKISLSKFISNNVQRNNVSEHKSDTNCKNWSLSSKERNRLQHCLNGNPPKPVKNNVKHQSTNKLKLRRPQSINVGNLNAEFTAYLNSLSDITDNISHYIDPRGYFNLSNESLSMLVESMEYFGLRLNSSLPYVQNRLEQVFNKMRQEYARTKQCNVKARNHYEVVQTLYLNNPKFREDDWQRQANEIYNSMQIDEDYDNIITPSNSLKTINKSCSSKDEIDESGGPQVSKLTSGNLKIHNLKFGSNKNVIISPDSSDSSSNSSLTPTIPNSPSLASTVIKHKITVLKTPPISPITPITPLSGINSSESDDTSSTTSTIPPTKIPNTFINMKFIRPEWYSIVEPFRWLTYQKPQLISVPVLVDNSKIEIMEKPAPVRPFQEDLQTVLVNSGEMINYDVVEIKNENFGTIFKTPDIISNMCDKELYEVEIGRTVMLPKCYEVFAYSFFSLQNSFDEDTYLVWCRETVAFANKLVMSNIHYTNLVKYGPRIMMLLMRSQFAKLNSEIRETRQQHKISKLHKITTPFLNILRLYKLKFCSVIKNSLPWFSSSLFVAEMMSSFFLTCFNKISSVVIPQAEVTGDFLSLIVSTTTQIPMCNTLVKHVVDPIFSICKQINCIAIPDAVPLIGTALTRPISCLISPVFEEVFRDNVTTFIHCLFESLLTRSLITVPLHISNYVIMKTELKYNLQIRILIHSIYNVSMLYTFGSAYCASSLFALMFSKKKDIKKEWSILKTMQCIDTPIKSIGIKLKDMSPHVKRIRKPLVQVVVGPHQPGYLPVAFDTSKHNEKIAVENRILKTTPPIDKVYISKFRKWVKSNLKKIFPITSSSKIPCLSIDDYLLQSNATPTVKKTLRRAHEDLVKKGITPYSKLNSDFIHKETVRKSFVKNENLCYKSPNGVMEKAPRLIQGGKPKFIVLVALWISSLQKFIKKDWNSNNFICFTSGVSQKKASKLSTKFNYWLEDDVSAWDASCSKELLEVEAMIFETFGCPLGTMQLIKKNINTRGVTGKGWFYKRSGCRKSGDPYTSVGNSILNGLIHLFIFCMNTKKSVIQSKQCMTMLVQGDDSLINMSQNFTIDWKSEMKRFGFKADAFSKNKIYNVEFCSMRFLPTPDGPVMSPILGKVISKITTFCNPPTKQISPYVMLRGSAISMLNAVSPNPILHHYMLKLIQLCNEKLNDTKVIIKGNDDSSLKKFLFNYNKLKIKNTKLKRSIKGDDVTEGDDNLNSIGWTMNFKKCESSEDYDSFFFKTYGFGPGVIRKIHEKIDSLTLNSEDLGIFLSVVIDRDTSGPKCFSHINW